MIYSHILSNPGHYVKDRIFVSRALTPISFKK